MFALDQETIEGKSLKELIESNTYYLIFADLKAFSKGIQIVPIETYNDFLDSSCALVLLIVDCSYVTIYSKEQETIELLYRNALICEFEQVSYLTDETDGRTRLISF